MPKLRLNNWPPVFSSLADTMNVLPSYFRPCILVKRLRPIQVDTPVLIRALPTINMQGLSSNVS